MTCNNINQRLHLFLSVKRTVICKHCPWIAFYERDAWQQKLLKRIYFHKKILWIQVLPYNVRNKNGLNASFTEKTINHYIIKGEILICQLSPDLPHIHRHFSSIEFNQLLPLLQERWPWKLLWMLLKAELSNPFLAGLLSGALLC